MNARCHVIVSGFVQGVNFRFYTRDAARRLGLKGWVRNRMEGEVEIVAEGAEDKVKAFVEWARKGPSSARVRDVKLNWEPYEGEFKDFNIRF